MLRRTPGAPETEAVESEPELITLEPATTAVIRGTLSIAGLANFFDTSFRMLPETISLQGVAITGPAFALYCGLPGETADIEVGFATDRTLRREGKVVASSLPGGRIARLVHVGGFGGLGASWMRLRSWIRGQGLSEGSMMWEGLRDGAGTGHGSP